MSSPLGVPPAAVEIVKRFEGFHRVVTRTPEVTAVPYLCPALLWTIGWGSLCAQDRAPINQAEGEVLLARDLHEALAQTVRLCPTLLAEPQRRLAAVVDFTFNLGAGRLAASTLRKRIASADWRAAAVELRKWVWGGGRKLPGLIARREVEAGMII